MIKVIVTTTPSQTHSDKQLSDGVVCKHLLVCERDLEGTILLGPLAGPVLLTLLLSSLFNVGHHGNYKDPLLPHQPPEVSDGVWEGVCESFEIVVGCINPSIAICTTEGYYSHLGWLCTSCVENSPVCWM